MARQGGVKVGGDLTDATAIGTAVNAATSGSGTAGVELGAIGDTACR